MAMKMARAASRKKTLPFAFSAKHVEYIRRCAANQINVAEGAVRAGKTVDNVFAFAHELKTTPDKIHLATGSTAANAKLNIGDANGFGLEHIFRGQSRWGKYKGNDCLTIKGPDTGYRSGAAKSSASTTRTAYGTGATSKASGALLKVSYTALSCARRLQRAMRLKFLVKSFWSA